MKSYKLQEDSKENTHKFTAKQRVQQFRNQFFKNITNTGFEDIYAQDKQEWNKIQTQIKNPSDNRLKQKRNHSVMNFDKISKKQSLLPNQKFNIEFQKDVGSSLSKRQIKVRKDFDAKVDNITKINDKIFDLLKYVKQRPATQQQKKPEYNIESLRAMQLKKIKQSFQKQSKYNHTKSQRNKNNSFQQAMNASQNTATFQHIQTNNQKPIKSKYSIPIEQDSIENIRQKTQTNQYLPKRYHKVGYQRKNTDLSAPKTERQKYQYYNYEGSSTEVQQKINLRKTQMLDEINLRSKNFVENSVNNSKKNQKNDSKNNFNYSKYLDEQQIKTPQRPRKSIGIVKNSPIEHPKKQITEFSIDNQINKVRSQIQQSQSQRQKLAKKYSQYNLKSNTKEDQKDNVKRKSQLTLSVNPPTNNEEKYKQLQSKYNYENSKKIGSSKLTIKSINGQTEQMVTSERKTSTNAFELKLYPCQNVEKKEATLLAEVLGAQVSHDQRLRQVRQRFISYNNKEKWQILKQMLAEKNIKISVRELEEELTITADEHNPFSKQSQNSGSDLISELAQVYSKSLNFWQKKLSRCVSKRMLQKQSFYMKDIDLQKKGYLSVEDLVCFVNLFSGNFFRNRDFIMVYKRFLKLQNSKNGIEYNTLLNKISSD